MYSHTDYYLESVLLWMRVCPKAAFPRTMLMFLNGPCRQPELQISEWHMQPWNAFFSALKCQRRSGEKKPRWKKCNSLCGKSGSACRTTAQLWIKKKVFYDSSLPFLAFHRKTWVTALIPKTQKLLKKEQERSGDPCFVPVTDFIKFWELPLIWLFLFSYLIKIPFLKWFLDGVFCLWYQCYQPLIKNILL